MKYLVIITAVFMFFLSCTSPQSFDLDRFIEGMNVPDEDTGIAFENENLYGDEDVVAPEDLREMVFLPGNLFRMGSPESELSRSDNEKEHVVRIKTSFYMNKYEVTQSDFEDIMGYNPMESLGKCDSCPVGKVGWNEALEYANRRSMLESLPECFDCVGTAPDFICSLKEIYQDVLKCKGYRLPTESEWEYASRGEESSAFYNGNITKTRCEYDENLDKIGWYCGNSGNRLHVVGQKLPNKYGIFDMSGNALEWTMDWYREFYPVGTEGSPAIDPVGPDRGYARVARGGSFADFSGRCRGAARFNYTPSGETFSVHGFRLAKTKDFSDSGDSVDDSDIFDTADSGDDSDAPRVVSVTPGMGAYDITDTTIVVEFDRDMAYKTVKLSLSAPLPDALPHEYMPQETKNGRRFTYLVEFDFEQAYTYTAILPAEAEDIYGNRLGSPFSWTFVVEANECISQDWCAADGDNGATCVNKIGGYTCICSHGFSLVTAPTVSYCQKDIVDEDSSVDEDSGVVPDNDVDSSLISDSDISLANFCWRLV